MIPDRWTEAGWTLPGVSVVLFVVAVTVVGGVPRPVFVGFCAIEYGLVITLALTPETLKDRAALASLVVPPLVAVVGGFIVPPGWTTLALILGFAWLGLFMLGGQRWWDWYSSTILRRHDPR